MFLYVPYHNDVARALDRVGLARRCRHRPPRAPRRRKVERPDRSLVPLKAGHPRTPMPPFQASSGTPMRSPDIVLVQLQPTSRPSHPSPTTVPLLTPIVAGHRSPCGRSPKPRLSLPRVRISTPSNVPYMYRYHIDPGGSRERVALPLSARLCGQWAGCAPPRRPLQGTMFVLSQPVADNVSGHVRLIWKVQRVRTRE